MKKEQLKEIIKPIVKECINEVLLSEGLLASVISEVVSGLSTGHQLVESNSSRPSFSEKEKVDLKEVREKMLHAVGKDAYKGVNVFEGTTPMKSSGSSSAHNPLSNVDPKDPGVDISGVFGTMSSKWGKIARGGE